MAHALRNNLANFAFIWEADFSCGDGGWSELTTSSELVTSGLDRFKTLRATTQNLNAACSKIMRGCALVGQDRFETPESLSFNLDRYLPPSQFRHAQLAHEGGFLGLMPLHTSKHVAKKIERSQNMRTFIEHYAFRSSGHCRISHFGSRR